MDKHGSFLLSLEELAKSDSFRASCAIHRIKEKMEPAEAEALEKIIVETQVSARKIGELLRDNNYSLGDGVIWKHRKKSCACFRGSK